MLKAKLVVVGGDAKAGEVNLKLPTIIGRGKEAGLTVPHALVSRRHTEIFERDGKLVVRDLGSLNGTFINNTRIEGEQILDPNQLLTLGNITFRAVYEPLSPAESMQDTVTFEESKTEEVKRPTQPGALNEIVSFDETVPVESLSNLSSPRANVETVSDESPAKSESKPDESKSTGYQRPSVKIDVDLDSDIFTIEGEQPAAGQSVSMSALGDIETGSADPGYVSDIQLGDESVQPKAVDSEIQLDLGSEHKPAKEVDESRLGSFLKKLQN